MAAVYVCCGQRVSLCAILMIVVVFRYSQNTKLGLINLLFNTSCYDNVNKVAAVDSINNLIIQVISLAL
jgi:hypothetical protein